MLAVRHLTPGEPVQVVGSLLRLDLVRNPGAAFSTGTSYTALLSVIALVAAGVVIRFGRRLGDPVWAVALGLLLAGVCGNLTDRIFREPGSCAATSSTSWSCRTGRCSTSPTCSSTSPWC